MFLCHKGTFNVHYNQDKTSPKRNAVKKLIFLDKILLKLKKMEKPDYNIMMFNNVTYELLRIKH